MLCYKVRHWYTGPGRIFSWRVFILIFVAFPVRHEPGPRVAKVNITMRGAGAGQTCLEQCTWGQWAVVVTVHYRKVVGSGGHNHTMHCRKVRGGLADDNK